MSILCPSTKYNNWPPSQTFGSTLLHVSSHLLFVLSIAVKNKNLVSNQSSCCSFITTYAPEAGGAALQAESQMKDQQEAGDGHLTLTFFLSERSSSGRGVLPGDDVRTERIRVAETRHSTKRKKSTGFEHWF